jgi:DNA-binding CsgD family transcriptional regulator
MGDVPAAVAAHEKLVQLCAGDLPPLELLEQVASVIRPTVPYAASASALVDPATLLCTSAYVEGMPLEMLRDLTVNEHDEQDFTQFTHVARLPRPVVRLSEATAGEPARSARHSEIYAPSGYGAELRAMFRARGVCWGRAAWIRAEGEPDFSHAEVAFLAGIGEHVAQGLRTGQLIDAYRDEVGWPDPPGMVIVGDDDSLESLTGEAETWLRELSALENLRAHKPLRAEDVEVPGVISQVAKQARILADTGGPGPPARARVRLPSGRWLSVHGARLHTADGGPRRTAVMLEPARRAELVPLIVEMYGLTERESEVTQLLVSGRPIEAIAQSLYISPYTVRDHVKSIFKKLGVTSRPELTALLFDEHYLPQLHNGAMRIATPAQ